MLEEQETELKHSTQSYENYNNYIGSLSSYEGSVCGYNIRIYVGRHK